MARRIPMTAREQLLRADELGHRLTVNTRTFPEFPDAPPKFYLSCSCGWEGRVVRSIRAVNAGLVWHMAKVIGEDEPHVNGT